MLYYSMKRWEWCMEDKGRLEEWCMEDKGRLEDGNAQGTKF